MVTNDHLPYISQNLQSYRPTNCVPLLADLFLHSYEAKFSQKLVREKNKTLFGAFNSTIRYIDDDQLANVTSILMLTRYIRVKLK